MKLSKLYGMQIASENKKIRGYILGITCVGDKIDGFICCDQSENEFFAKAENFRIRGESAVFSSTDTPAENSYSLRLGRAAYDESGKFIGQLDDCLFKGDVIETACIARKKYAFSSLAVGDIVILKSGEVAAKDMFIDVICGG